MNIEIGILNVPKHDNKHDLIHFLTHFLAFLAVKSANQTDSSGFFEHNRSLVPMGLLLKSLWFSYYVSDIFCKF